MASTRLDEGRRAVAERAWRDAHGALLAARRDGPLTPEDLWGLALASYLVGEEHDFLEALREAHQAYLDAEDALSAVRSAFWIGQHLASRGDVARASGWFGRAARVVEEREAEGAARGYLLLPLAHRKLMEGDYEESARVSAQVADIGRRCRSDELAAIATHVQGRALLRLGRLDEGLALLDEAMTSVGADELSPIASGLIYCSVISACREVWALRRAQEWTTALTEWCASQPDMIAYTGPCRVSRAEILKRRGKWSDAIDEARLAVDRFEDGSGPGSAGPALYEQGEVYRLRGEYASAEDAYRAASAAGREAQPGLALLRLAQGRAKSAVASLRRALAETDDALGRARFLPSYVEILLELGELEAAARACDELDRVAEACGGSVLEAMAAQARGATLSSLGEPGQALPLLRRAFRVWEAHDVPYEAARVRTLIGAACRALGDEEGAALETDAARRTFEALGAAPDVARLGGKATESARAADHGLTPRELEVLEWLATGRTNRDIADALSISEKTVARHVSNIFSKLGLPSRAAATAYAYEHGLVSPST